MNKYLLGNQLERSARLYPNKPAVIFNHCSTTWAEVMEAAQAQTLALAQQGVATSDRVAVLSLNSDYYFSLYFAVPSTGAIIVPLNTRLADPELVQWVNDCGAKFLLVGTDFVETVQRIRQLCPSVSHYLYLGDGPCPAGMQRLETVTESTHQSYQEQDIATLFYTGGTTGRSKGVIQTHEAILVNTLQWIIATQTNNADTLLIATPMFHLVAGTNCIAAATLGATVVILPRFEPELALQAIEKHGVTKIALVPTMVDMLIRYDTFANYDISSLKEISYGAAPMPEEILSQAQNAMPHVKFTQIYGQTECCGAVSCLPHEYHTSIGPNAKKRRSAGRPLIGTDIAIFSKESVNLSHGDVGEICVRGPSTTRGYWGDDIKTQELYWGEWLRTGDLGYMDADGFLYIVDRLKDMIVTGGENVFASEVENVLYNLDGVLQCAVIGIPSDKWGEQVHAVIMRPPGSTLSEDTVMKYCRDQLANYKCVRSVEFQDEGLPVNAMNKILKQPLRDIWWKGKANKI